MPLKAFRCGVFINVRHAMHLPPLGACGLPVLLIYINFVLSKNKKAPGSWAVCLACAPDNNQS